MLLRPASLESNTRSPENWSSASMLFPRSTVKKGLFGISLYATLFNPARSCLLQMMVPVSVFTPANSSPELSIKLPSAVTSCQSISEESSFSHLISTCPNADENTIPVNIKTDRYPVIRLKLYIVGFKKMVFNPYNDTMTCIVYDSRKYFHFESITVL